MAGSRTVQAARYSLCRPSCFPGGGYSVQTQELGPLCLKMPACQTFSLFRPPSSMLVTHNAVACSYFVIKSTTKCMLILTMNFIEHTHKETLISNVDIYTEND